MIWKKERERHWFVVPPIYSLVDSCMCSNWGMNPQSWLIGRHSNPTVLCSQGQGFFWVIFPWFLALCFLPSDNTTSPCHVIPLALNPRTLSFCPSLYSSSFSSLVKFTWGGSCHPASIKVDGIWASQHRQSMLTYSACFNFIANLLAPARPSTPNIHWAIWGGKVFTTGNLAWEAFVRLRSEAPTGEDQWTFGLWSLLWGICWEDVFS